MRTSDKELDELFNSKLNNFEAEPSAKLWQNIHVELDKSLRKKKFVPVLQIAASVVILLSVGLFWIRSNETVTRKTIVKKAVKLNSRPLQPQNILRENKAEQKEKLFAGTKIRVVKEAWPRKKAAKILVTKQQAQSKISLDETSTLVQNKLPVTVKPDQVRPAIVPDGGIVLKLQPAAIEGEPAKQIPVLSAQTNKPAPVIVKRKGIRNMGDLVNLVMAKVDKRQDKLIEFTDNDGESNITGINLGIITIKKEK